MATIKQQETSAGRVLNSSLQEDPDASFRKKFGVKWDEYRQNWAAAGGAKNPAAIVLCRI